MPVFSADDLKFFDERGYVIARNIVPHENCEAVVQAIFEFLEMNPDDPNDWYRAPHSSGGMVEMYQHQALWDNRQYPRVHEAFAQLVGTPKLWVTEDRVGFKVPPHPSYPDWQHKGFTHWDIDTSKPLPQNVRVQGLLVLRDTDETMGGFQCVPGFHKNLEEWIARQPADRNPHAPDLNRLPPGLKVTPIAARAGDLIIWNVRLAHGNGYNQSNRPRFAQYISMHPAREDDETYRQGRIERWQKRQPPPASWVVGDPRHKEEREGSTAQLTPLGRKLLGLDSWD